MECRSGRTAFEIPRRSAPRPSSNHRVPLQWLCSIFPRQIYASPKESAPASNRFEAIDLLPLQGGDAFACIGNIFQLLARIRAKGNHRWNRTAIFAHEIVNQIQAFFDFIESLRIEFDLIQIIAQTADELRQRIFQRGGLVRKFFLRFIDLRQVPPMLARLVPPDRWPP